MKLKKATTITLLLLTAFVIMGSASANGDASLTQTVANDTQIDEEPLSSPPDEVIGDSDAGTFTALQIKINKAGKNSEIILENDYELDDGFEYEELTITKALIINGNGHKIDGKNQKAILYSSNNITLKNITFMNGKAIEGQGSGIQAGGQCTVINCTFINCSTTNGGAINFHDGSLTIINTIFTDCTSTTLGGVIYSKNADCRISGSKFENAYSGYGGTIYLPSGTGSFDDCDFINCSTGSQGSILAEVPCAITNCRFVNCRSTYSAAAITSKSECNVTGCNFTNCRANYDGGAIWFYKGTGTIKDSNFYNCTAVQKGGAVYYSNATGKIENCNFTKSSAEYGGAVYINENTTVIVTASNFENNSATELGGAVYGGNISECGFKANSDPQTYPEAKIPEKVEMTISVTDIFVGETEIINVTISNITCSVNVLINGSSTPLAIENGRGSLPISSLAWGTYNVTVIFSGTDDYQPVSNSISFDVLKREMNYDVSLNNDTGIIELALPSDITGEATFEIGSITKTFSKTATLDIRALPSGTYAFTLTHPGDEKYNSLSAHSMLQIPKSLPEIIIYAENIEYGDMQNITVVLPEDLEKSVNYTFQTRMLINKTSSQLLGDLAIGNYSVHVEYEGDSKYYAFESNASFTVMPKIRVTPVVVIEEFCHIYIDLGNVNGTVRMYMNGEEYESKRLSRGKIDYDMNMTGIAYGHYNMTFEYIGKDYGWDVFTFWDKASGRFLEIARDIEILPLQSRGESKSDENLFYEVKITNDKDEVIYDAEGSVRFFIDGVEVAVVEVVDGIARLDISKYKNGIYSIRWEYSGDMKYNRTEGTFRLAVEHRYARIAASDLSMVYTEAKRYAVTVYDADGKPADGAAVTFLLNNRVIGSAVTIRGVASIAIAQNPGTYSLTVKALGSSISKRLTVSHVLTLKSVKVKKSAKKLILTATLKKINGKYLKNMKVTFKFNGKTYTSKTNKKGVAKATVKSKVLKKLKVGKKVNYQATFKKDTIKKSAKIKK